MTSFSLRTLHLSQPINLTTPTGGPRPRAIALPDPETVGEELVLQDLECAFWVNWATRSIHVQIAHIANMLPLYSPDDFDQVAADPPEAHVERLAQVLGTDPQGFLQAFINGEPLPVFPQRLPMEIPNWRAKVMLSQMGLLAAVETAISALPEPDKTVVSLAWAGDAKLARRGKSVTALAAALGLTDAQVDQLFISANAIEV